MNDSGWGPRTYGPRFEGVWAGEGCRDWTYQEASMQSFVTAIVAQVAEVGVFFAAAAALVAGALALR